MTIDDALRHFAKSGNDVPREAMQWALDHWENAGPRLVALLAEYAAGTDRSEQTELALFTVIHLLADRHETAAFGPLCALLLDGEASELILGDAITQTLAGVLINTYDGDPAPLRAVIEAEAADEYARHAALLVMAYFTRIGRVAEAEMRAYLLRLRAGLRPQGESFVWYGWVASVENLGLLDLVGQAEELCRNGFVPNDFLATEDIARNARRARANPADLEGFVRDGAVPFGSAIEQLAKWQARSEMSARDDGFDDEIQPPFINPLRGVGRNDPCPCGSGRKYKKCCLV